MIVSRYITQWLESPYLHASIWSCLFGILLLFSHSLDLIISSPSTDPIFSFFVSTFFSFLLLFCRYSHIQLFLPYRQTLSTRADWSSQTSRNPLVANNGPPFRHIPSCFLLFPAWAVQIKEALPLLENSLTLFLQQGLSMHLSLFLSNLLVTVRTLQIREVLNIILDSNFDAKLFSSQNFYIQEYHEIASSIALSKCYNK